jgi:HprK-related kinase B
MKQPDPGKTKIKEEYYNCADGGRIVRKRLTGMVFAFSGKENLAVGPCCANANQVVNFINSRLIARHIDKGCCLGHAAAVARNDRGLALAGFSGMGKSTLALRLMNSGCLFVSNDRVLLSPDDPAVLYGVPKQPRINPGTALHNEVLRDILDPEDRERFSVLPPEKLWKLEHKYDALINRCYGPERFILQVPFAGLVVLNWRRKERRMVIRRVQPAERPDLVRAFIKDTGLFYMPGTGGARISPPDPAEYVRRLACAPMLELSGMVDFDQAAAACLDFLDNPAKHRQVPSVL